MNVADVADPQSQFGWQYQRIRKFRDVFRVALRAVSSQASLSLDQRAMRVVVAGSRTVSLSTRSEGPSGGLEHRIARPAAGPEPAARRMFPWDPDGDADQAGVILAIGVTRRSIAHLVALPVRTVDGLAPPFLHVLPPVPLQMAHSYIA